MPTKQWPLKVFLSHAHSDKNAVSDLYMRLTKDGIDAWLDKEKLLPGQDWEFEIRKAVHESDVVVVCLSKKFNKAGFRQKEVRLALDTAMEKPEGEIFIIPARLDDCDTLESLRKWHRVDLFEVDGYESLLRALRARADKIGALVTEDGPLLSMAGTISESGGSASENETPSNPEARTSDNGVANSTHHGSRTEVQAKTASKVDPAIIAALIGVVGTLLITLITLYANRPTQVSTPSPSAAVDFTLTTTETFVPTKTVTPTEPTSTLVPSTHTAVPTPTGVPPVLLGEDWIAGCISTVWIVYPLDIPAIEKGNGCWKEPMHVFSAENGDLDFLAERRNAPSEIYGLFAALPETGTVTFSVRLRDLTNVDLWMGIFAEADVNSEGLLMIVPSGDVKRRVFVQKDPQNYDNIADTRLVSLENGFSITFSFDENSARSIVNPSVFFTNPLSIPTSQKWLFLGYKGLGGSYRVDGTFLSFELK